MKHRHIFWLIALLWLASGPGLRVSAQGQLPAEAPEAVPRFYTAPEPARPNLLLDSLRQLLTVQQGDFMRWVGYANSLQEPQPAGTPKAHREAWILGSFGLMLLFFGIIKTAFPGETTQIVQAFYNDRVLAQVNKEDNLFSSWPFVFLYILFGFSCGLFLYLVSAHFLGSRAPLGFQGFLWISVFVLALFSIKIFATRMLGIVFEAKRLVREYISVLYLCYFNASLVFIPAILMLSLATNEQSYYIIWVVLCVIFGLFAFRLLKTGSTILEKYRFPKFYLITYLCTLEIVPMLILMKVLA